MWYLIFLKMMPLLHKNVDALLEHFEPVAKSDKSVNVVRYVMLWFRSSYVLYPIA